MSAIGPGDFVECVDASPTRGGWPVPFVAGAVYLVERLHVYSDAWACAGAIAVVIRGCPNPYNGGEDGWNPGRFAPVYRPKQSLILDLLQPIKEDA